MRKIHRLMLSGLLALLLLLSGLWSGPATAELLLEPPQIVFYGRVTLRDEATGIPNATIDLMERATGTDAEYVSVMTARSDAEGRFTIRRAYRYRVDYRLRETNPPGYVSHHADADEPGVAAGVDAIDYIYPMPGPYGLVLFVDELASRIICLPMLLRD